MSLIYQHVISANTIAVARGLLGHCLCYESPYGRLSGIIVETEAYLSKNDPACHAHAGKTRRNATMFGPAGLAYVYFIYGRYHCFNVVTGPPGFGEAVLIRAVEPLEGLKVMKKNRGPGVKEQQLTNGPGKLCLAFDLNQRFDGHNLSKKPLYLADNKNREPVEIVTTQRIGISCGQEKPLRFYLKGNRFISRR